MKASQSKWLSANCSFFSMFLISMSACDDDICLEILSSLHWKWIGMLSFPVIFTWKFILLQTRDGELWGVLRRNVTILATLDEKVYLMAWVLFVNNFEWERTFGDLKKKIIIFKMQKQDFLEKIIKIANSVFINFILRRVPLEFATWKLHQQQ